MHPLAIKARGGTKQKEEGERQKEKREEREKGEEKQRKKREKEERDSKGKKNRGNNRRRRSSVGGTALPHCHLRLQRRSRHCEPTRVAPPPRSQCREGGENNRGKKKKTQKEALPAIVFVTKHQLRLQLHQGTGKKKTRETANRNRNRKKEEPEEPKEKKNKRKGEDGGPKHVVAFVASR
jgi:hypothetical protein